MAKSDVNGPNANNVYKYLRMNARNFTPNAKSQYRLVPWNFSKFLVTSDLSVIEFYNPLVKSTELHDKISNLILGISEAIWIISNQTQLDNDALNENFL